MNYKAYITKFYVKGGWDSSEENMNEAEIKGFIDYWNNFVVPTKVGSGFTWVLNKDPIHESYITIEIKVEDNHGNDVDVKVFSEERLIK